MVPFWSIIKITLYTATWCPKYLQKRTRLWRACARLWSPSTAFTPIGVRCPPLESGHQARRSFFLPGDLESLLSVWICSEVLSKTNLYNREYGLFHLLLCKLYIIALDWVISRYEVEHKAFFEEIVVFVWEKDNFMLEAWHCVTVVLKKKIRFGFRCNAFSILTYIIFAIAQFLQGNLRVLKRLSKLIFSSKRSLSNYHFQIIARSLFKI